MSYFILRLISLAVTAYVVGLLAGQYMRSAGYSLGSALLVCALLGIGIGLSWNKIFPYPPKKED